AVLIQSYHVPLSLNRSLMAHSFPPIAKVPDDVLAEVFVLCLPSHAVVPTTHFDSPVFISPSPAESPLLLCSVSSHWRAVAVALPRLWE
ncbi:hypothetical protein B0H13DRAFT_1522099, partial [Mycena leptocephala]